MFRKLWLLWTSNENKRFEVARTKYRVMAFGEN